MVNMINKTVKEDHLFELCRTSNNLDKLKNAIEQFEKQNSTGRLDENNNLIVNQYGSAQNASVICNLRDSDGRTLLHHCVTNYTDQQACCQYLLQNYPQLILTSDYQGYTIIHLAVLDGNVKLLKFICTKGRKLIDEPVFRLLIHSADNELHSAIHWAVICQEYACLEILIETIEKLQSNEQITDNKSNQNELGINMRDIHGATCLHYAAMLSAKSKFFDLLSEESRLNRQEHNHRRKRSDSGMVDGNSSLSGSNQLPYTESSDRLKSAEKRTALKILNKILHCRNIQVNSRDNDLRTPLMWSARLGECKAVKELLSAGSNVSAQDNEGRTALHCAATKGDKACIETLFKHGNANINAEDKNGSIPLHYASKFGSVDACRTLLNLGSFVDSINFRGQSVVHCAASKGNYWICRTLVDEFEADLWKRDAKGELALHYAVRSGNKELVKWILSLNPSAVNVGNNFGRTAMHLASQTNNIQLCKMLIDCGASVNALMKQRNFNEHLYHQMDEVTRKTYLRTSRREKFGISMGTTLDLALQRNYRNCAHFLVMNGAFPAAKLGLNNILSKSNPNLYLDPEEGSKDSNDSTFETEHIRNEINSNYHARQSPYSNSPLIGMDENHQQSVYGKSNEPRFSDKLRKTTYEQVTIPMYSMDQQYSAELPNLNSNMNRTDRLIDELVANDQQKRSHSQPMFTSTEHRSTSHHFVQSENGLDINQYALVQNSSGSSMIDYSVDDLTKTQSIITNVYLNCSHQARRTINPVRKRKTKLIKTYSSQRNLNYDINDELEQKSKQQFGNQYNSMGDLLKDASNDQQTSDLITGDNAKDRHKRSFRDDNFLNELLDGDNNDDFSNTSGSVTELKNLKISDHQQKSDRPAKLNQLREETRKSTQDQKARPLDTSQQNEIDDKKPCIHEDSSSKPDSRCSHYLHFKPGTNGKYSNDYSHVKHKVDTRNNLNHLRANLLRSKSNLEDLALEELDEAGEIMQNAEKSMRKYQIERKLLQELQDLKRYQIRSSQVNEAAFVKRLAEQFRKQNKHPGMPEFFGPYSYKNYEKYLYDQIRKLSTSNEGKVPLPLLNIINMNVYDQPKQHSSRFLKSKKISKSTEDTTNEMENEKIGTRRELKNEHKFNQPKDTAINDIKKEPVEIPIKITPLNINRKDKQMNRSVENVNEPKKMDLLRLDYAQTDENETLQDISTSFSEEKFDSLPEQMNSEAIRKQFHETFKSMSIVNEELSDQDSSLIEAKKTKIEKQPSIVEDNKLVDKRNESQQEKKKNGSEDKLEKEKLIKVSFEQINQTNKTVDASMNDQSDSIVKMNETIDINARREIKDKMNTMGEEKLIDENNNKISQGPGEIIITNVSNVQKIFAANYLKQEQSELIKEGWVLVDSIKEIDEKENELIEERSITTEINKSTREQNDLEKQISRESVKIQNLKDSVNQKESKVSITKQDTKASLEKKISKESTRSVEEQKTMHTKKASDESTKKQDLKESNEKQVAKKHLVQVDSKATLQKQDSIMKQSSDESSKEKIIKIDRADNQVKKQADETTKQTIQEKSIVKDLASKDRENTRKSIDRVETKILEKAKGESSTSSHSKGKSTDFTSSSSDSKIPKISNKKSVKQTSTSSTTSTPSKKSISSKSSSIETSKPDRSHPPAAIPLIEIDKTDRVENALLLDSKIEINKENDQQVVIKSLDKTIISTDDLITINKIEEESKSDLKKEAEAAEVLNKSNKSDRRLSVVSFETNLLGSNNLDDEDDIAMRKKYAKTPIKQLSIEEKADLVEKLNEEEFSVPTDDPEEDSSPQSLNDDINREEVRRAKNDLIENIDKKLREESIKKIEEIEQITVRNLIDEEKKMLSNKDQESEFFEKKSEKSVQIKDVKSEKMKDEKNELTKIERIDKKITIKPDKNEQKKFDPPHKAIQKKHSQEITNENKNSEQKAEEKIDEKLAKADNRSEIIFKKSSIEKTEDVSERTALIENMLRTSGYTEKIIEKANEFISGKDSEKAKEDGVVEEVCVKLVKKNSKDYYNGKSGIAKNQDGEKASSEDQQETYDKKRANNAGVETVNQSGKKSDQQTTTQQSTNKSVGQLKKTTSLSKIPAMKNEKPHIPVSSSHSVATMKPSKNKKHIEIVTESGSQQKQDDAQIKVSSLEQSSYKRNCLKSQQTTKSEPIEQAINRPEFKRKKSNLPPKYSINLNNEEIRKKWNDIKTNEKDKLQHQFYSSHLRRTTSNPVISNSFDLIYEVNKMPQWAQKATNQKNNSNKNSQNVRSNTTSIITQTKRILEKIEKKEIEDVTTRTIISEDEEQLTTKKTSREESRTNRSETEESSISGKQCSICKKIIIPITDDMKFCKRDLRKMLSDSALEIKHCRC